MAKDAVDRSTLGLLVRGECSLWLTRFSLGFSVFHGQKLAPCARS